VTCISNGRLLCGCNHCKISKPLHFFIYFFKDTIEPFVELIKPLISKTHSITNRAKINVTKNIHTKLIFEERKREAQSILELLRGPLI